MDPLDPEFGKPFRRRVCRAACAVTVLLLSAFPSLSAPDTSDSSPLEVLARMFREEDPGRIRQIAPKAEKILMDSESLGFPHGYYSVDQVCLVLETVFRSRSTLQFNFLKGAGTPEPTSRIVAVGRWMFRTERSREKSAQIAFTLVRRNGGWTLKELRDVP